MADLTRTVLGLPRPGPAARITRPGVAAGSIANEFQCQPGHDEGCEKDRQEPLSGTSEGDDLFLRGVEGLRAARVSSVANLQGVTSRLDRYLDRVVHLDRPGPLTVDHDIVGATTDLGSDCLMRYLQRRRHLLISSCRAAALPRPCPARRCCVPSETTVTLPAVRIVSGTALRTRRRRPGVRHACRVRRSGRRRRRGSGPRPGPWTAGARSPATSGRPARSPAPAGSPPRIRSPGARWPRRARPPTGP